MEADAGKRKRGGNWTAEEKNILFSLIKPKISIIENKCLTTNANAMKEQAWKDVYNEFCVIFGNGDRSVPRLKEQWKRLKSSAKCNLLKFEHRNPTGGKYPPHLEFDINLLASLPQELTKGDAEFDSDAQVSYEVSEIPVTLLSPSSGEITSVEGISIPLSPTAVPSTAEVNSVSTNLDQCALTVPTVINKEQSSGSEGDCSSSERHGKDSGETSLKMTEFEAEMLQLQKEKHESQMKHDEELHQLQKTKLLLEIELLKAELERTGTNEKN